MGTITFISGKEKRKNININKIMGKGQKSYLENWVPISYETTF